jgi:hypothetical protein
MSKFLSAFAGVVFTVTSLYAMAPPPEQIPPENKTVSTRK